LGVKYLLLSFGGLCSVDVLIVTGEPRPELKWFKDGQWVQQTDRIKLVVSADFRTSELNVSESKVEDSGVYCVEASNIHGTSQTVTVVKVTDSVMEISEKSSETLAVENITETVEESRREDAEESSLREDIVVTEKKENAEQTREIRGERVEISRKESSDLQLEDVKETEQVDVSLSERTTAQTTVIDGSAVKMSRQVATMEQEDVADEHTTDSEEAVHSYVPELTSQSPESGVQETVQTISDGKAGEERAQTSLITELISSSVEMSEERTGEEIKLEIPEVAEIPESPVSEEINKGVLEKLTVSSEADRITEVSEAQEELVESLQTSEYEEVRKTGSESTSIEETGSETSAASEIRTVITKETVTKKKKSSKLKHKEESNLDDVDATQDVDETEEDTYEEVLVEDKMEEKDAEELPVNVEERKAEDTRITETITTVAEALSEKTVKDVVGVKVETIEVDYSEEEFEGPLPVIEVKPQPMTVKEGETARLQCKVAEEPAAEICWSRNGQKLQAAPENTKIHIGKDAKTGMQFLEIAEMSLEDAGEYTLTVKNEGGVVVSTVSVDVTPAVEADVIAVAAEVAYNISPQQTERESAVCGEEISDDHSAIQVELATKRTVMEKNEYVGIDSVVEDVEVHKETEAFAGDQPVTEQHPEHLEDLEVSVDSEASITTVEKELGVKTLIIKETVTKKKKKSKEKQEKVNSETTDVTETAEDAEDGMSESVIIEDAAAKRTTEEVGVEEIEQHLVVVDKKETMIEDQAVTTNIAEVAVIETQTTEAIEVDYSEKDFEGPLPVIEVKPQPMTVKEGESARLQCKVVEEPAAEICWSRNGQKLQAAPENTKIRIGTDAKTGMQFLEIAEMSVEDAGEYTLTVENEGGIVTCTVSVGVVSELKHSVTAAEDGQQFRSLGQITDSEVSELAESLGKVEAGEVVITEGSELLTAAETVPVFVSLPQPVFVDEGSPVRLQCQVEG